MKAKRKVRARKTVRVADPAIPDENGQMPRRTSRARRASKRRPTPLQEERRVKRALGKEHPRFKSVRVRKRISAEAPQNKPKVPRAETERQRKKRLAEEAREVENAVREKGAIIHAQISEFLATVKNITRRAPYVRRRFRELFGKPPKGVPLELLQMRVAYELQVRGYHAAGVPVPARVQQNWEAASKYDVSAFHPTMRSLLACQGWEMVADDSDGGTTVADSGKKTRARKTTRKKAQRRGRTENLTPFKGKKGKRWGLTMNETWVRLFEEQPKKKKTDDDLVKFMSAEFPDSERCKRVATIRMHRGLFNRGKIAGQSRAPRREVPPFDGQGNELPKNYRSGETVAPTKKKTRKGRTARKKTRTAKRKSVKRKRTRAVQG